MTRIIVAGGRDGEGLPNLSEVLRQFIDPAQDIMLCGMCPSGVDYDAYHWAKYNGVQIQECHANWTEHGKAAGPIRNKLMAQNADVLVAFWDGKSRGTRSMINEALNFGLEVHVYHYEEA